MRRLTMHDSLWGRVCSCGTCGAAPGFSKRDTSPPAFSIACPNCRVVTQGFVIDSVVEEWNEEQVEAARAQG